jgi:hypothetical protein
MKLTKEQFAQAKELCNELPIIEDRLRRAGLWSTASALHIAVERIGYEVAENAPKEMQ